MFQVQATTIHIILKEEKALTLAYERKTLMD